MKRINKKSLKISKNKERIKKMNITTLGTLLKQHGAKNPPKAINLQTKIKDLHLKPQIFIDLIFALEGKYQTVSVNDKIRKLETIGDILNWLKIDCFKRQPLAD